MARASVGRFRATLEDDRATVPRLVYVDTMARPAGEPALLVRIALRGEAVAVWVTRPGVRRGRWDVRGYGGGWTGGQSAAGLTRAELARFLKDQLAAFRRVDPGAGASEELLGRWRVAAVRVDVTTPSAAPRWEVDLVRRLRTVEARATIRPDSSSAEASRRRGVWWDAPVEGVAVAKGKAQRHSAGLQAACRAAVAEAVDLVRSSCAVRELVQRSRVDASFAQRMAEARAAAAAKRAAAKAPAPAPGKPPARKPGRKSSSTSSPTLF